MSKHTKTREFTVKSCGKRHARCGECQPELMAKIAKKQSSWSKKMWENPEHRDNIRRLREITIQSRPSEVTNEIYERVSATKLQRTLKDMEKWLKGDAVPLTLSPDKRSILLMRSEWKCSKCEWAEPHEISGYPPLEIDHIDGDHDNNHISNLQVLCPNCHALTKTYKNFKNWKGSNSLSLLAEKYSSILG